MAEVEERLSLDITDALTAVGTLEAALTGSVDGFQSAMDAAVAALTGQLESLSATQIAVEVAGDTAALEAGVAAVDDQQVVVEVDADTGAAEAAIADLAGASSELSASLADVESQAPRTGGSLTTAAAGANVLSGGLAAAARGGEGLGGALSGVASKAGPLGAGIAAVVGSVVSLGLGALDADLAARRLDATFGDLAGNINSLQIDGLGDSLSEIAIAAASDDDALRLVAASIGDLGAASGKTKDEASALAETILTMAAKLAVLRPELGSAEQIADRLTPALARGGRALTQFGLAVPSDKIAEMAQGFAGAGEEVTQFDKVAAGASLTAGQLTSDATKLAAAADAPTLTFRRLNVELGETLEAAGSEILPELTRTVETLTPVVVELAGAFADLAAKVAPTIADVVVGTVDAAKTAADAVGAVGAAFDDENLNNLVAAASGAATSVDAVGSAASEAGDPLDRLGGEAAATAGEFDRLTAASKATDEQLSAGISAAVDRDRALRDARDSLRDLNEALKENGPASKEAENAGRRNAEALIALDEATIRLSGSELTAASRTDIMISRFSELAKTLKGEARAEVEGLIADLQRVQGDYKVSISDNFDIIRDRAGRLYSQLNRGLIGPRAFAHGGPFHANELILVGEEGPEFVRFGQAGTVINNTDSRALAGSGSTINVYEVSGDPYATAFAVGTELGRAATR